MIFKELHTERLLLRKVEATDNEFVLQGYSNDELTKFMLHRYYTLEEVKVQMQHYQDLYNQNKGLAWVMQDANTRENIGIISLFYYEEVHQRIEIGFWSLPQFWGKGYTTEAGKAVINYCFAELGINRVQATVETENVASIGVIKKIGLTHEGTFREYEINNGKFIDLMTFSILKKEWKA